MAYLDITTEDEARALATLEEEGDSRVEGKRKSRDGSLCEFCGLPAKRSQKISKPLLFCTACKSGKFRERFGYFLGLDIDSHVVYVWGHLGFPVGLAVHPFGF